MKQIARAVTVSLAALVVVAGAAAPALAHPADYLNWNDNHTMCQHCRVDQGNIVGFWQSIAITDIGGPTAYCDTDGYFGPITDSWTHEWQRTFGLASDGIVGPNTWDKADNWIVSDWSNRYYHYVGVDGRVDFRIQRGNNGNLIWQPVYENPKKNPFWHSNHPQIYFYDPPWCT